jgi:hypothetical protein
MLVSDDGKFVGTLEIDLFSVPTAPSENHRPSLLQIQSCVREQPFFSVFGSLLLLRRRMPVAAFTLILAQGGAGS